MFDWILNMPLDSQLLTHTHRLAETHFTTIKFPNSQLRTRKLLSLHFADTQLPAYILELLTYENIARTLLNITLAVSSR